VEEARSWDDDDCAVEGHVELTLDADPPLDILNEYLEQTPDGRGRSELQSEHTQDIRPKLVVGSGPVKESELSIKEEQRARMEANKLKALERARARKLELERSQSGAPA
jgi:TIMELESS-interacting protein